MSRWRSNAASLSFLLLLVTVGGALYILDKVVSRPDRVDFSGREDSLQTVRDALMRYEYDRGSLPASLDILVPAYLRRSQIELDGVQLYVYASRSRTVSMARGATIRGLIVRERPPAHFVLPPRDVPARPAPQLEPEPEPEFEPVIAAFEIMAPPPPVPKLEEPVSLERPAPIPHVPAVEEGVKPPEGALVIEAEHYSELNWGWEVRRDENAGGGAYIICKEGMTTGSAQCHWSTYNFYDVREGDEQSVLKYHFTLSEAGEYYILGRLWATCTHCSNSINVGVDTGGLKPGREVKDYYGRFMRSSVPFRWRWAYREGGAVSLEKGDHYLYLFPHEDGIYVDQLMLVPAGSYGTRGNKAYRANLSTNAGTAFARDHESPAHLTFDLKSMVIAKGMPAECNLAIRKIRRTEGTATVRVILHEAGPSGEDLSIGEFSVDLGTLPELSFVELDFSSLDYVSLPRREYLLTAEMTVEGKTIGRCDVSLMHPFDWKVSGMMQYMRIDESGPLDGSKEPVSGAAAAWHPFKDVSWSLLGVMDFGVQTVGNSLHAPEMKTIYVRTTIDVPATDIYILKAQSDDQMILWIDGREAGRIKTSRSVIRNVRRWRVNLEKGVHDVRIRINQGGQVRKLQGGYWQASLRFRTKDDDVSRITGK